MYVVMLSMHDVGKIAHIALTNNVFYSLLQNNGISFFVSVTDSGQQ